MSKKTLILITLLLGSLQSTQAQAGDIVRFWFENSTSQRVLVVQQDLECFDEGLETMFDGALAGVRVLEPGERIITTGEKDQSSSDSCYLRSAGAYYQVYPESEFDYYNYGGGLIWGIPHPNASYLEWRISFIEAGFAAVTNAVYSYGVFNPHADSTKVRSGIDGFTGFDWEIKAITSTVKNYDVFYSLVID